MFANSDRPMEIAMTHRAGAGGMAERVLRPESVREVAQRVQRWAVTAEVCKSCSHRAAVSVRGGFALCGSCRDNYLLRLGREPEGLSPVMRVEAGSDDAELQGYGIVFNSPSVDMGFIEYIRPAAADRMVSEKPDLRYLWNHNSDVTLARVSAGTMAVEKRTRGVFVAVNPPKWAGAYVESVQRRDITGQSFGFYVLEDDWHLEEGYPVREILDMHVLEISAVSFPAYEATTLKIGTAKNRAADAARAQQTAERLRMAR